MPGQPLQVVVTQNAAASPEATSQFFQRLLSLQFPSQQEFMQYASGLHVLGAIGLLAAGVFCMIWGWKFFKAVVIVNAAGLGAMVGYALSASLLNGNHNQNMPIFGGIAGALLLGAVAWPLMKYSVSLMGGLAGSVLGYGVWHYVALALGRGEANTQAWAGGLMGFIALGLSAFVIFRAVVIAFTSLQGVMFALTGLLGLLMKHGQTRQYIEQHLNANIHMLPLLILVPTVIAFVIQETTGGGKKKAEAK